ncbi:MAG TPA: adenylosuccinate lyase family protein [Actinomycetota bacterium]|nr:adenylosuccinate lyase family protein [Actinomycetota bacterium]
MVARLTDSELYAHLWGTEELRAIFEERRRLQSWLDILVALAGAQAELGIIPPDAAAAIAAAASVDRLDLAFVAAETRRTSHSTLGLIRGLERVLPPEAREHVYYGATVQDLTDTWTALAMRGVGEVVWRDLHRIRARLVELAARHRDTVMAGRTHGQPGAPITFGLKAASWADEVDRHLARLRQGAPRWLVGQLGGAVGTLAFFGEDGPELRARFSARLGLGDPGISWLTARDRLAEFGNVLAMVAATLARIGNEVYELQRPEIGELREAVGPEVVGSITMPHKQNPEGSEHLVTLGRLVRAQAGVLLESMVTEHERDGRAWKAEWAAFPEACLLTGAALALAGRLLDGLEVDTEAMARNLAASRGYVASERVLAALAPALGKHSAQALLQETLRAGAARGHSLEDTLQASPDLRAHLDAGAMRSLLAGPGTGSAGVMVDEVVGRLGAAGGREQGPWP